MAKVAGGKGVKGAVLGALRGVRNAVLRTRRSGEGSERFRGVFDEAGVGIALEDTGGRIFEVNRAFEAMFGYSGEELRGKPQASLARPGDASGEVEAYYELLRGERDRYRSEKRYVCKDRRELRVLLDVSLVRKADGSPDYFVSQVQDVTEREEAAEALRVSERRFRAVIEQSPLSINIFALDGEILVVNRAWERLWDLQRDHADDGPSLGANVFEDRVLGSTGLLRYVRESVEGGVPVRTPALLYDPESLGRAGERLWLEASIYPVRDGGRTPEMALLIEDVTEQKRALEDLAGSEERFRSVVQNASDIITIVGPDGEIRYESPAVERVLGYGPEELVGKDAFDFVHPEDVARLRAAFSAPARGGARGPTLYRIRHKDGSWRYLESTGGSLLSRGPMGAAGGVVVSSRDVTERRRIEEDLRLKDRALTQSSNGVIVTGPPEEDCPIVYYNPAMERLSGYRADEVSGRNPRFLQGRDRDQVEARNLSEAMRGGRDWFGILRNYRKDGTLFWNEMYVSPVRDEEDPEKPITHYVGVQNDVTSRKLLEERLAHQAFHDPLTGLPNRALFMDRLGQAVARARRTGGLVAVAYVDLDNFKYVNDSLGHDAGDELLVEAARRLRGSLRSADTVGRIGGDEFTVLLEGLGEEPTEEIEEAVGRIRGALLGPFVVAGREVFATASIGLAVGGGTPEGGGGDLLKYADAAMYEAKRKGKDRHEVFEPGMALRASGRLRMEHALRRALEGGEFSLAYQPEAPVRGVSEGVAGFEALLRWNDPEGGPIPPAEFVPLAEETGAILQIGRWALEEACRQAVEWRGRYPRPPGAEGGLPTVWVNLSARQRQAPDLAAEVAAVLEETGLPAEGLGLEITESVLMEHGGAAMETLGRLKMLGVQLAIDDFGTGYSSLAYLKRLPVDLLKIDRTFVAGLGANAEDEVLVGAMIELARAFGLKVVAEGVETPGQLERLKALGCDLAQGYHLCKPMPAEAASRFLEERLTA